jgi:hypothetical protein
VGVPVVAEGKMDGPEKLLMVMVAALEVLPVLTAGLGMALVMQVVMVEVGMVRLGAVVGLLLPDLPGLL